MEERGTSAPLDVPTGEWSLKKKSNKIRCLKTCKRLPIDIKNFNPRAAACPDRCGVGSGGAARDDVVVSGSLEARGATASFGAVLGLRTSITRAKRESTRVLGRLSKRPKKTSCAGTVRWETAAPSGVLVPK